MLANPPARDTRLGDNTYGLEVASTPAEVGNSPCTSRVATAWAFTGLIGTLIATCALLMVSSASASAAAGRMASTDAIASQLAGRTVVIKCTKSLDWWGRVEGIETRSGRWLPGSTIQLAPKLCKVFADGSNAAVDSWTALAMLTLTHEIAHVRGVDNEVEAECYGLRHLVRSARAFGFSAEQAAWMRTTAARDIDGEILMPNCPSL